MTENRGEGEVTWLRGAPYILPLGGFPLLRASLPPPKRTLGVNGSMER